MQTKTKKIIVGGVALVLVAAIGIALVFTMPLIKMGANAKKYNFTAFDAATNGDRIHFMDTQSADAILIESNGKFALIDAAEDSDNPRDFDGLKNDGYEQKVLAYVKKIAGNEQGKVELEFVLGTHAHSDHIGGFDTLILDPDVTVKKAYVKQYEASKINDHERDDWDNQEVFDQMINACKERNVEVVHNIPTDSFAFENFNITFLNVKNAATDKLLGENENSLGVLVEKDGKKAFLAGDINNHEGDEERLGKELGDIDLLKVGHHGYGGSTSKGFAKALQPEIAILTNTIHGIDVQVRKNLNSVDASIYGAKEHNGIVVEFGADGLTLYDQIH